YRTGRHFRYGVHSLQPVCHWLGAGGSHEVINDLAGLFVPILPHQEHRRLGDPQSHENEQDGRQHHGQQRWPPVGPHGEEPGRNKTGQGGADGPPGIHGGEYSAAMFSRREFSYQGIVHRDGPAEPETGDKSKHRKSNDVSGDDPGYGEDRKDSERGSEGSLATDPVGERGPNIRTQRHAQQVGGADQSGLASSEIPVFGEQGDEDTVEGDIPGVEHKAQAADDENAALDIPFPWQCLDDFAAGRYIRCLSHTLMLTPAASRRYRSEERRVGKEGRGGGGASAK